jgi:hypothetical protein
MGGACAATAVHVMSVNCYSTDSADVKLAKRVRCANANDVLVVFLCI